MPFSSSAWSGSGSTRTFRINVSWSLNTARPCPRDDGSPLIPVVQNRALHTGVHIPSGPSCDSSSGTTPYHALSDGLVLGWLNNTLVNFKNTHSLPFDCGSGVNNSTGLAVIHCDNDGSLY
jgi:hypothetical protein